MFDEQPFVGLDNYLRMFRDQDFLNSLWRTFYFTAVSICVQVVLGLLIAEFLNINFRGRRWVLVLMIIPWAIPTIVNGTLWLWILDGSTGALNHLLLQLGIIERDIVWLGRPMLAMNMIILADTWRMLPLYTIMFLAGRQSISSELYEAASIYGAGFWQQFFLITLPLLKPVILVVLILRTLQTFRVFDIIFAMTKGGPAGGTTTVTFLTYFTTFRFQNFGYGSALAFFTALTTLALALIYIRTLRSQEDATV
jgi:multiple sugar transport system permease protein/N,N'-diacetylchitobiose transport system permease protein